MASSSPHFPPLVLPKVKVTITAVNDPHICSTKRKLKQNKNKLTKPKIPWIFGIKILLNLDNKKIISSLSFWTFVLFNLLAHIFDGETTKCNNVNTNFWKNNNPSVRYATVILRRELSAENAGIFTGTSCGTPTYKIKDIYVYF